MFARASLAALWVLQLVSLFGFVAFAAMPSLLTLHETTPVIFAHSLPWFARGSIALSFVAVVALLSPHRELAWRGAATVVALSAGSELIGVAFGLPFGSYRYTELLGPKIAGLVPWLIPLSWLSMVVPSYALATVVAARLPASGRLVLRIGVGALLLVAWDFVLDPAMSIVTPYWLWEKSGPVLFGIPLSNLGGWLVTGTILLLVVEKTRLGDAARRASRGGMLSLYSASSVLPVGMALYGRAWGAVAVAGLLWLVMCAPLLVAALRSGPRTTDLAPPRLAR